MTKLAVTRQAVDSFERTLAVVDAAITGAVLGGLDPEHFSAILSLWFLRISWGRFVGDKTADEFDEWIQASDPDTIWMPVIERVFELLDEYEGELEFKGELELDIDPVRKFIAKKTKKKVSELEERRQYSSAVQVVEWLLNNLMKDGKHPESTVEICFLVSWFKMMVLIEKIELEDYLLVKQNWLQVQAAYGEVMTQDWSKV